MTDKEIYEIYTGDNKTLFEKFVDLLKENFMTPSDLEKILGINRKVLLKFLDRLNKLCKRKKLKLIIRPARCLSCGYTFNKKSIKIPSKCPKCKSEWIEEPSFHLEEKK